MLTRQYGKNWVKTVTFIRATLVADGARCPNGASMKIMTHLLGITGAIAFVVLCTVLPFLPGRYDSLAMPLSMMGQLFGKVGLLLVPVGAVWAAFEYSSVHRRKRYGFAIAALIATSIVCLLISLAAMLESVILGLATLALWSYVVARLLPRVKSMKGALPDSASAWPLYLIIAPIAVALIQAAIASPITERSRSRAIHNSAPLISDIEQYRAAKGRYPLSIVSVNKDYKPDVIGISEYRYEPSGEAYNLFFEQTTFMLGTREIVMYNPRGEHVMTSHARDVLQLTPEQLALDRTRGHNAVHDANEPNWKYFWFD